VVVAGTPLVEVESNPAGPPVAARFGRAVTHDNGGVFLLPGHFDMPSQRSLQLVNQSRFHVAADVGDVQADDLLSTLSLAELFSQHSLVLFFHDEDNVRPTDMPFVDPDSSLACRIHKLDLGLPSAEEAARPVGERCHHLHERTIAGEVREINPVGRREVVFVLDGIALVAHGGEGEGKVAT
jgi:hypothetical protein